MAERHRLLDEIRLALNMAPDERFAALHGILFDNAQMPEVLDAIFDDALNRPDEIKMPILEALGQAREHPLFAKAVRVLDIVKEQ